MEWGWAFLVVTQKISIYKSNIFGVVTGITGLLPTFFVSIMSSKIAMKKEDFDLFFFCLFPTVCGVTPPLPTSQTKTNQTKKNKNSEYFEKH